MGYDLHITRRENWFDEEGPPITATEFETAVDHDPDLDLVPVPAGRLSDRDPVAQLVVDAVLLLESGLHWRAGRISGKNPSDLVVEAMCRLAKALNAQVQGDDGEFYEGSH